MKHLQSLFSPQLLVRLTVRLPIQLPFRFPLLSRFLIPMQVTTMTLTILSSLPAHALQVIEARDGVTVEAVISMKEPTRIRIENAPITDVFGNIYSNNCAPAATSATSLTGGAPPAPPILNPSGEIALECDRDKGEIYVRPIINANDLNKLPLKPINLFISSQNATYTLLLRGSDTPSDTIVIRDKTVHLTANNLSSARENALGISSSYVRSMKRLLVAMASDEAAQASVGSQVRIEEMNRPIQLWSEVKFSLIRTYEQRGLIGEKYLLTNISDQIMVLAEQEFDRAQGDVIGVAIDNLNLRPGESISVYVLRRGDTK